MKKLFFLSFLFFLLSSQAFAAQDEKKMTVIGIGKTEEDAKMQAYRNAIQSTVGTMVQSEVLIENEQLLRDQVLSYSDGYVVSSKQIGKTHIIQGGLFEVTMEIVVKNEQLKKKLKAENVRLIAIDGENLLAGVATIEEKNNDALKIIENKIKKLPETLINYDADIKRSKQKAVGSLVQFSFPLKLYIDQKVYADFTKDLKKAFSQFGYNVRYLSAPLKAIKSNFYVPYDDFIKAHTGSAQVDSNNKPNLFNIFEILNLKEESARWVSYRVPDDLISLFSQADVFDLRIELLDTSGSVITASTYTHSDIRKMLKKIYSSDYYDSILFGSASKDSKSISSAVMLPRAAFQLYSNGVLFPQDNAITFDVSFDLTRDELRSIRGANCVIISTPRKQ